MKIDNYCVYIHRNAVNNKAYIGITKHGDNPNKRWRDGVGYIGNAYFYNAIQKYGWSNFEHIIWADGLSQSAAQNMEVMLIALFDTTNPNYGYNISVGGEAFSLTEAGIIKRTSAMQNTKNKNRIQQSIAIFKDRFDNGDSNILQCQKCGAYFEKDKNILNKNKKKDAAKKQKQRIMRKYCDYCAAYHKQHKKIVTCVDCGVEFVVSSKDTKTCRCEKCKQNISNN